MDVILTVIESATTDNETTISAEVGGRGYNDPSHFTFAVRDGRVSRMTIRQ